MRASSGMSKAVYLPNRGDIIWLVLDPRTGHEQSGRRPAIVLSPKYFTKHTSLAIICPITGKVKGLPFEVELKNTKTKGAVLPIHIRSVDVAARKAKFIEKAPESTLETVNAYVQAAISQD
jgi:mRNA interferase MazF